MIPIAYKQLAEVNFPIAEVSRHAAREQVLTEKAPLFIPVEGIAVLPSISRIVSSDSLS